jgi:hypothetical protein
VWETSDFTSLFTQFIPLVNEVFGATLIYCSIPNLFGVVILNDGLSNPRVWVQLMVDPLGSPTVPFPIQMPSRRGSRVIIMYDFETKPDNYMRLNWWFSRFIGNLDCVVIHRVVLPTFRNQWVHCGVHSIPYQPPIFPKRIVYHWCPWPAIILMGWHMWCVTSMGT